MDTAQRTELDILRQRVAELEQRLAKTNAPFAAASDHGLISIHARVLESMAEGVCVSDERGYILYTNPAEDAMFGYERGELLGQHLTVQNSYPADENERIVASIIQELKNGGSWKGELLNRKKNGASFYTRARISALEIAGVRYWVCVQEDVTDRRDAEVVIRDAKETLQALIVASPLPIVAFTRDGAITLWNPAAERVFGWSEAEVLGKPLPFIPEEKTSEHRAMRDRDLRGEGFTSREIQRRRKDGTEIDISVSTAAMHDAVGHITGIMSVYVDITEQKKFAEEQRRSMEMLRVIERQLTLLVEASGVLLATPQSEKVLSTILELAQRFIDAEAYAVWRKRGDEWHLLESTGLSASYERTARTDSVHLPDHPLIVPDVENSQLLGHRLNIYRTEGIRSLLAVPMHVHGEVDGRIVFYYRSPHSFTEAEKRVSGALGNLASSALTSAELYGRQAELRELAQSAERRSSFMARVGEELASSLDYETTLTNVARLAVPWFADWCAVDIVQEDGGLRRLAVEHIDPKKIEFAYEFGRRYPPAENSLTRGVMATGEAVLVEELSDEFLAKRAPNPEYLALIRSLGLRSVICVPLSVHGRTLGLLTFVASESGRNYAPGDLRFAEEIARRAAVAVENARLFKEVRESEERFRRLYDTNMVAVAFWSEAGYITDANDAFLEMVGYAREELPIKLNSEHALDADIFRECKETGASAMREKDFLRRDGSRITVLIAAAIVSSSQYDCVAFLLDITDRKKLEKQFRGLSEAAIEISAADSVNEILRVVQDRARVLIGADTAVAKLVEDGVGATSGSLSIPLKDGEGVNIGFVQVTRKANHGFTENDEAILIQLVEMASIAIQNTELNDSLRLSNEELRRANEDLNQFAYSASHDLQEPLRMISIYTQLLSRRCGNLLDSDAHDFMKYTRDGAQRMEMLLRDLLAYTHAVNIRGVPEKPVDAGASLRKAIANLETAVKTTNATIHVGELPAVRAYDVHLMQLFQNLVGNALKYRSAAPPVIEISASADTENGRWLFSIRDNGIGIAPRFHEQVFGLFKRLYSAQDYPGTGIGLAICQKLVERYGGRIWLESEEGRGTTFFFTLPA
jgi:PAS domain S-box-containing protein